MIWRVANRRKGRRLQLAGVEPYLGDIIGEAPAPMRPVYLQRIDARCWVQRFTHQTLAVVACTAFTLLLAAHLYGMFVYFPHSPFMVD
jgi:hypothetical protein